MLVAAELIFERLLRMLQKLSDHILMLNGNSNELVQILSLEDHHLPFDEYLVEFPFYSLLRVHPPKLEIRI